MDIKCQQRGKQIMPVFQSIAEIPKCYLKLLGMQNVKSKQRKSKIIQEKKLVTQCEI